MAHKALSSSDPPLWDFGALAIMISSRIIKCVFWSLCHFLVCGLGIWLCFGLYWDVGMCESRCCVVLWSGNSNAALVFKGNQKSWLRNITTLKFEFVCVGTSCYWSVYFACFVRGSWKRSVSQLFWGLCWALRSWHDVVCAHGATQLDCKCHMPLVNAIEPDLKARDNYNTSCQTPKLETCKGCCSGC